MAMTVTYSVVPRKNPAKKDEEDEKRGEAKRGKTSNELQSWLMCM